jgi:hypothetical protein
VGLSLRHQGSSPVSRFAACRGHGIVTWNRGMLTAAGSVEFYEDTGRRWLAEKRAVIGGRGGPAPTLGCVEYPGMQQQHAIEFFFIAEASSLWGFHWLIEWSTSSFYVKCLHPAMQSAKVSLHGPDPKHPGKQHLRFDLDHADVLEKATKAGSHWSSGSDRLPFYFGGRQVNDHAAHIVRFSAEWNTFIKGAPGPGNSRGPREKSTFRALVRAPERDHVSHVDLYLSTATRIGPMRRPPVRPKPEWAPSPTPSG